MFSLTLSRRRKRFFPRNANDAAGCLFVVFGTCTVFLYNALIVIPFASSYGIFYYIHITAAICIVCNIIGNFVYLILTDTSILTMMSSRSPKQGWRFCSTCEANVPPRSFHCSVCRICILKRDHHCVFSGCCVGYFNHRYYICLLAHLWLGTLYAVLLSFFSGHFWQWLRITDIVSLLYHMCPVFFWITGKLDTVLFCNLAASLLNFLGFLFVSSLLVYHCDLILKGQTTHEKNYNVLKYKCSTLTQSLTNVLGTKWYLALIWFNARSELTGDGVSFTSNR